MARPKLNTSLIKSDKIEVDDIIDGKVSATFPLDVDGIHIGRLFVRSANLRAPKWTEAFDGLIDTKVFGLTSSPGAVLLIDVADRKFCVTFGLGLHLLAQEAIEEQFALRVTLNSIDGGAIRSLDKKSFDVVSTQTREQASREVDVSDFGLDVDQDLLSSVTGVPRDKALGERLSGKSSLKVSSYNGVIDLPGLCLKYFEQYQKKDYERRFKFIDQVREISDPELVQELDDTLVQRVKLGGDDPERCWLAAPNVLDWSDVAGFKFKSSKSAESYPDIYWKDFLKEMDGKDLSLDELKKQKVAWLDGNGTQRDRWSVYKCINCEIEKNSKMFLLNGGKWYEVEIDFVTKVNDFCAHIHRSDLQLIPYAHTREDDYLRAAAEFHGPRCACMDQVNIIYGGGHSRVEFCDLFVGGTRLVHVKRYGASSTLSHLFAQGATSGRLFAFDPEFRARVNEKLPVSVKSADGFGNINPAEYEIVFAIISNEAGGEVTLPFFSRVNLQNAAQLLKSYGFNVSILKIRVDK